MRLHPIVSISLFLLACGGGPERLATGLERQGELLGFAPLAAEAQNAYVVQLDASGGASLEKVPIAGSAPTTLLTGQGAGVLSVDANYLYWSDGVKVGAIPLAGGAPNLLDTRPSSDFVQALGPAGGDRLFWLVNNSDPTVGRSGLLRGYPAEANVAAQAIADFPGPNFAFATDHDALYWSGFNGVFTRGLDDAYGSPISRFSDSTSADRVVADGINVYWTQFNAGYQEEVRVAPRSGGPSRVLATVPVIRTLAVDGKYAYWRTPRCIERAPLSGGPTTQVAQVKEDAYNLAASPDSVLWIDQGALYRIRTDQLEDKAPDQSCGY